MLKKYYKKAISLTLIIVLVILFLVFKSQNYTEPDVIEEFIKIVLNNEEYYLSYDELETYNETIDELIKNQDNLETLKKGYCALGYINFMLGDYHQSVDDFEAANNQQVYVNETIELMITSGLSKAYMLIDEIELSQQYFLKAEEQGRTISDEFLSSIYRAYSKTLIKSNYKLEEALAVASKSLQLNLGIEEKIKNKLYLASMFQLMGNYVSATHLSKEALNLALEHDLSSYKTKSVLLLANTYYLQRKYNQAISLYEEIINNTKETSHSEIIDSLGYLIDSYVNIERFDQANKYIEKYLVLIEDLEYLQKNQELNWIYALIAKVRIRENKYEEAREALDYSRTLYLENPAYMYNNVDIWLEQLELALRYQRGEASDELLQEYFMILEKIESRGIKTDLRDEVINDIIKISKDLHYNEIALMYMEENLNKIKENESINYDSELIDIINNFKSEKVNRNVAKLKKATIISIGVLIASVSVLFIINNKNKKIKLLNRELYEKSVIDYLTEVYNKRSLYDHLRKLIGSHQSISCILIDIDYFKKYNDTYGHLEGDKALKKVAQVLKEVYDGDFVSRYGGEEFCIVSFEGHSQIIKKLQKMNDEMKHLNMEHHSSLVSNRVTVSAGLKIMTLSVEEDVHALLKEADHNLYLAKQNGRNQFVG